MNDYDTTCTSSGIEKLAILDMAILHSFLTFDDFTILGERENLPVTDHLTIRRIHFHNTQECGEDALIRDEGQLGIFGTKNPRARDQMVMWNFREQMVDLMGANVMNDIVKHTVISVHRGKIASRRFIIIVVKKCVDD